MSLRNLGWFWWRRFRHRARHEELFALVGFAVGVALLFAVQVSNQSLRASIATLTDGVVGDAQWQLTARDARGFEAATSDRVAAVDGVRAVASVLELQANLTKGGRERSVTVLAADERLADLGGSVVRGPAAERLGGLSGILLPAEVATGLGASPGTTVVLQTRGRNAPATVAAVLGPDQIGPLAASPIAVVSLRQAWRLSGLDGRVSRLLVVADAGREAEVRAALSRIAGERLDLRRSDFDDEVFEQLAMPNDSSTSLFAAIAALVGFLFAFNAMLVMAKERRALIADMRMSGFRTRTVIQVIVCDALVLGTVASVLGIALGEALSRSVFQPEPGYLAIAFPVGTGRVVEAPTVLVSFAAGVCAAVGAALVPLLDTYRSDAPLDEVEDTGLARTTPRTGISRASLASAVTALLATTVIVVLAPAAALLGMATLLAAMLLSLPLLLTAAIALVTRVCRRITSVVPVIATGELIAASTRSTAIAAIAAIAVFGATAIEGARRDLQRGLDPNARELSAGADLWISARGDANLLGTSSFPAARVAERVEGLPEVASADLHRSAFLDIGDRRTWVIAPPIDTRFPFPRSQLVEGSYDIAATHLREGGWAVVSQAIVDALGLSIGTPFQLDAPTPVTLRLAAVTTNFGWSPGTIVLNADDYRAAWRSDDASALQVTFTAGTPIEPGVAAVERALGPDSPFSVQTATERERGFRATTRGGLARLQHIATLLIVAAALAIAAATAAMVLPRRARLADLKLTGIGTRSLWRALLLEAGLLVFVGAAAGALFGLYGQQLLDRALNTVTGFPVSHSVGVGGAVTSVVVVTAIALLITALPGWWAARVPARTAFDG